MIVDSHLHTTESLIHTVEHSQKLKFYSQHFRDIDYLSWEAQKNIEELPLLSKELLHKRSFDLCTSTDFPEYLGIRSGTTFGYDNLDHFSSLRTKKELLLVQNMADSIERNMSIKPIFLRLFNGVNETQLEQFLAISQR
ncbi:MAG: hypothetical protein RIM99_09730 [Cyclobacteriaceae bacterium]